MKSKEGKIIWSVYFDSTKPRDKGRRVPKNLAVEKPRLEEILLAAQKAGYTDIVVEKERKFPGFWYESEGRIIVKTSEKKSIVIKKISVELTKLRKEARRK